LNGSAVPGTAAAQLFLLSGAGGTPTWAATASPYVLNGSAVPATAAAGLGLISGAGGTPTWAATPVSATQPAGGTTASPYFFGPTAISALPTCTSGGVNVGAHGFVDNNVCSYVFGATALATTAANEKCKIPVFCGSFASATVAGTPVIGWIVGKNDYIPPEVLYPWNRAYYPGSRIPSPGLWEQLGKLVAK